MSNKLSVKDRAMLAMQFKPEGESTELPSESVQPVKAKTGPGALVAYLSKESDVFKENQLLKGELQLWSDSSPVKKLDCQLVHPSIWANRHSDSFLSAEYLNLKADIESAGGNVQAIKVRPIPGSEPQTYEIVFGHRRHRACAELGLPVLAAIESIDDQALFVEMDRENRQRADLRPYEQGVMYARALDEGLYASLRKMAAALGIEAGNASKYISLAKLPKVVIEAFVTPLDLQQRWAKALSEALLVNPETVIERAQLIAVQNPRPSPAIIFKKLIEQKGVVPNNTPQRFHVMVEGERDQAAEITFNPRKKLFNISLSGVEVARIHQLEAAIKAFLSKPRE